METASNAAVNGKPASETVPPVAPVVPMEVLTIVLLSNGTIQRVIPDNEIHRRFLLDRLVSECHQVYDARAKAATAPVVA